MCEISSAGEAKYDDRLSEAAKKQMLSKPEFVTVTTGASLWDITSAFVPGELCEQSGPR